MYVPKYDNLLTVRAELDALDRIVITLLAQRLQCTLGAVEHKVKEEFFRDNIRRKELLAERCEWGVAAGLSAEVVHDIFNRFIDFVEDEQAKYKDLLPLDEN